jgi:predicted nucleic acid-binding protein
MAADDVGQDRRIFLDTSLVVAATIDVHPSHLAAAAFMDAAVADSAALHINPQICREFLVVLTRQPVSGRTFTPEEALVALEIWMTGCLLLEESEAVVLECLDLVRRFDVHGKQVHDCNIVATMKVHGVGSLATRNPKDFVRYGAELAVIAID